MIFIVYQTDVNCISYFTMNVIFGLPAETVIHSGISLLSLWLKQPAKTVDTMKDHIYRKSVAH